MKRAFNSASVPDALRALGIVLFVGTLLFAMDEGLWKEWLLSGAWALVFVALVWRVALHRPILPKVLARDLSIFGLVSLLVIRRMHLPGTWVALAVGLIGALAGLWFDRARFWPTAGDGGSQPWLFYPALALVATGTLFRIQHWPYGTELLIGGLALVAFWFFWSMRSEKRT